MRLSIACRVRLSVDTEEPQGDVLAQARVVLDGHGVVAMPTETYYGLSVSVFDQVACARVFEIKGRPSTKALPCIVSGIEQLGSVASEITPLASELASRFWPGPLTLIVPARASVAAASDNGTVAVRVSSLPLAREVAAIAGPATATSANVSGAPPATTWSACARPRGSDCRGRGCRSVRRYCGSRVGRGRYARRPGLDDRGPHRSYARARPRGSDCFSGRTNFSFGPGLVTLTLTGCRRKVRMKCNLRRFYSI